MQLPIDKARAKYRREGVHALLQSAAHWGRLRARSWTTDRARYLGWRTGLVKFDTLYTEGYYEMMDRPAAVADAVEACAILDEFADPDRVLDLGCGVGRFLLPFHDTGREVYGVDAAQAALDHAVIPEGCIDRHDMTDPFYPPGDGGDLVICFEVLEHLPESAVKTAVASIARSAPVAAVSAAPPGQYGRHHVNTQPLEYWIDAFEREGMAFDATATEQFRKRIDPDELRWLARNPAIFRKD